MISSDWVGALAIGFLGSAHCIGMCGGIASAMSFNAVSGNQKAATTLFYNLGRLLSYMLAGAMIGGAIASASSVVTDYALLNWLRLLSALVMIVLGLYIGQWWKGLVYVEKVGQHLWRHLSPIAQRLLPLRSTYHAFPLGMLWGWLPCGLVYSALTWAAVSGSAINGASIMLAFGLGTLPSMLLMGFGISYINRMKQSVFFRRSAAVLLLAYGIHITIDTMGILA